MPFPYYSKNHHNSTTPPDKFKRSSENAIELQLIETVGTSNFVKVGGAE